MTATVPSTEVAAGVTAWLSEFGDALAAGDPAAAAALFTEDCYWRDLIAFTWNIKTLEGRAAIASMLGETLPWVQPGHWKITGGEEPAEAGGVVESWIDFETAAGRGWGHLRLRDGRCWTLLTTLYELKGHEERHGPSRPKGVQHGADPARTTWLEDREHEAAGLGFAEQPYVLIVGGGQAASASAPGSASSACPRSSSTSTSALVTSGAAGTSHCACMTRSGTTTCRTSSSPTTGRSSPPRTRSPTGSSPTRRSWSSTTGPVPRRRARPTTSRPASGRCTSPGMACRSCSARPSWSWPPGCRAGPTCPPSPAWIPSAATSIIPQPIPGPDAYRGRRCVVIGSNNSAFDICGALWENGADVTMVQRSSTNIVRSGTLMDIGLSALYSEEAVASGMTTDKADMVFASIPYRIMHVFQTPLYDQMRERDQEFYDRLEAAGFDHDWGDDGSGLFMKYLRRGSGYYIDVGSADLVANGDVALARGQVDHLTEDAVVLEDGTTLPADLVVYATGYESMNGWAAELISQEVADKVGKCWGLGSSTTKDPGPWEGEQRNMWKPTQQEALWFHGGNLHQSRHYSLYLALQLKARQAGIPTPVYGLQEVHHLR